ncbi:hypothetical protein FDUTEX481_05654 [Tolypothrix sp. PCC 7601]|nr:hypothetical protein FDUTEX481_05654 [Tolypothrix sp. PCC 7601]
MIDLLVVETASTIGGFSPKPPIGGRLRPPNPLQNYCFCCQFIFLTELYWLIRGEVQAPFQYCSVKDFQVGIWFGEKVFA